MEKIFVTITQLEHYYNHLSLTKGDEILLVKDTNNKVDFEAIMAKIEGLGKIGYVANSVRKVKGDCYNAGYLYDKFDNECRAKVIYSTQKELICEVVPETIHPDVIPSKRIYFTIVKNCSLHDAEFYFHLEKNEKVVLRKETTNQYDKCAIEVRLDGIGTFGWVANSCETRFGETYGAGRLYNKIGDTIEATIAYAFDDRYIAYIEL